MIKLISVLVDQQKVIYFCNSWYATYVNTTFLKLAESSFLKLFWETSRNCEFLDKLIIKKILNDLIIVILIILLINLVSRLILFIIYNINFSVVFTLIMHIS